MNNADRFKQTFGIYAEEFWSFDEKQMLDWLNADVPDTNVGDTISRQAAIDAIADYLSKTTYTSAISFLNTAALILARVPSAQPETRWIPVTERLPEKDGMFLVSISPSSRMEKRVDTDFYSHFGVWQIFGEFVTAWCELPEPYRKETEDENV